MASTAMARTHSNASDSDESNCITVLPFPEDDESSVTLTDRIPKQRSERKRQATKPKKSTSTRRSSRFVEESVDATSKESKKTSRTRNVSGKTLVEGREGTKPDIIQESIDKLDIDWAVDVMPGDAQKKLAPKKPSKKARTSRLNDTVKATADAVASAASVLGKRGRDVLETGKEKIEKLKSTHGASLRPRFTSTPSTEDLEPATKRAKTDSSTEFREPALWQLNDRNKQRKVVNRYITQGLYAGQDRYFNPRFNEKKNKKRSVSKATTTPLPENKTLPFPMFAGERLLENGRDFKLPFFICNPLMTGPPKADEWKKVKKNRFVGDAADHWRKHKPLAPSLCMCTPEEGCGENCHNVMMYYECDETNCNVGPAHCRNRNFADLKERVRKGGKFNIGVDVMMTADRGWGVRANRTFRPNQIIMEYAGEIITQEECENRMRNEYENNKCYYLMEFEQGMIIDATRGSMARFVNHSCDPNCRMEQWKVNGEPRMALFAGDYGILVGEELTYDYNFDPFSSKNVQECHCGAPSCRGVLGPRTRDGPKPKKDANGNASSSNNGAKRKLSSMLKRVDSSVDESDHSAKKPKTLKETARTTFSTTKSHLTNALQATETSQTQLQKKEKIGKKNDERAARLSRRRSGTGAAASSSPSTPTSSSTVETKAILTKRTSAASLAVAVTSRRNSRRHTLAATAVRTKNVLGRATAKMRDQASNVTRTMSKGKRSHAAVKHPLRGSQRKSADLARLAEEQLHSSPSRTFEVSDALVGLLEESESASLPELDVLEEETPVMVGADESERGEMEETEKQDSEMESLTRPATKESTGFGSVLGNAFERLMTGSRRARVDEMIRAELKTKKKDRETKKTIKAMESEV